MIKKSYAKVNLALNIKDTLKDGYHNLEMINVKTSLFDIIRLKISKKGNDIIIKSNKDIPLDKNNLVYQVIEAFKSKFDLRFSSKVYIFKNIPIKAGLAGGSGNAACVLKMLYKHFHLKENLYDMASILLPITSDGPYMLYDNVCKVLKKGEKIKPLNTKLKGKMLLIKPLLGCSTKEIFNAYDESKGNNQIDINNVEKALVKHDYKLLKKSIGNSLSKSIMMLNPDIKNIIDKLNNLHFDIVSITGSGSTCFAITQNKKLYHITKKVFKEENFDLIKAVNFK